MSPGERLPCQLTTRLTTFHFLTSAYRKMAHTCVDWFRDRLSDDGGKAQIGIALDTREGRVLAKKWQRLVAVHRVTELLQIGHLCLERFQGAGLPQVENLPKAKVCQATRLASQHGLGAVCLPMNRCNVSAIAAVHGAPSLLLQKLYQR